MPVKKKRNDPNEELYEKARVTAAHLCWLKNRLAAQQLCNLTWRDFSEISGISHRMMTDMLSGKREGGAKVAKSLMALRKYGVIFNISELHSPPPQPKYKLPEKYRGKT